MAERGIAHVQPDVRVRGLAQRAVGDVSGVDAAGTFTFQDASVDEYMLYMLRLQQVMEDEFGVVAKDNDRLADIANLAEKLGSAEGVEND